MEKKENNLNESGLEANKSVGNQNAKNENKLKLSKEEDKSQRPSLGRRISDAIPDKYIKHIAIGILLLLVLTFAFHFYNSFWGKRSKERQVESLKIELRQKDKTIDQLKNAERKDVLMQKIREAARKYAEEGGDAMEDSLIWEAYGKDVDPILNVEREDMQ